MRNNRFANELGNIKRKAGCAVNHPGAAEWLDYKGQQKEERRTKAGQASGGLRWVLVSLPC